MPRDSKPLDERQEAIDREIKRRDWERRVYEQCDAEDRDMEREEAMKTTPSSTRLECGYRWPSEHPEVDGDEHICRLNVLHTGEHICLDPANEHNPCGARPAAAPKHSDEIARKVAREIQFGKVPQGDVDAVTRALDDKRTEYLAGLISQAYAPLYEQKEELGRVLTKLLPFLQAKGYAEASEAEAALEKAGGGK